MRFLLFVLLVLSLITGNAQVVIKMKSQGGVSIVPSKVNGLSLDFIFDTGASEVSMSLTEATFMLKNGYLKSEDFVGEENFLDANGEVREGFTVILRNIEIGGILLKDIRANIVKNIKAPLLLGQSALKKLGTVLIDYDENTLTIIPKKSQAILVDTSSINNEISQKDLADSSSNLTEDEQFFRLGKEGFMNSDYTSAIYYFDRAIQINGNKSDYYFYRALSKDGSDELKDALIDYNTYLSMDKKSSKGYGYRAELLIRLGDTLGAIKDFQYAIQLDSKNIYAYRELAKVYIAKKSYALAIKYLNTATKFDSTDYSTFQIRGVAKFRNKNYLGARLDFDTAIILNPENSYSFTLRGAAKTELKQFESARNDLNKALEIDSSSAVTFRYLAQISEHYKELEQAVVYYKKALEIDSTDLHSTLKVYLLEQEIKSQIWISIFKSDDQEIFIKNEIESNKYGVISIWIKANKKKYTRVVNGKNVVYLNSYSTEFLQIDCVSKRMKIDYTAIYDSAGKTISSEQLDYSDWTVVPPETIGELIIKEVCKRYN